MASTLSDIWKAELEKQSHLTDEVAIAAFEQWKNDMTWYVMEAARKSNSQITINRPSKLYTQAALNWLKNEQQINVKCRQKIIPNVYGGADQVIEVWNLTV